VDGLLLRLEGLEKKKSLAFTLPQSGREFRDLSPITVEEWLSEIEERTQPQAHPQPPGAAPQKLSERATEEASVTSALLDLQREQDWLWQREGRTLTAVREARNELHEAHSALGVTAEKLLDAERALFDALFPAGKKSSVAGCEGFAF
jgi:hypothetical protein